MIYQAISQQLFDFIRAGLSDRVSCQLSFTGFKKRLAPLVVQSRVDAILTAEVRDTLLTPKTLENYPDLLLGSELAAGFSLDIPYDGFRWNGFFGTHDYLLAWFYYTQTIA